MIGGHHAAPAYLGEPLRTSPMMLLNGLSPWTSDSDPNCKLSVGTVTLTPFLTELDAPVAVVSGPTISGALVNASETGRRPLVPRVLLGGGLVLEGTCT